MLKLIKSFFPSKDNGPKYQSDPLRALINKQYGCQYGYQNPTDEQLYFLYKNESVTFSVVTRIASALRGLKIEPYVNGEILENNDPLQQIMETSQMSLNQLLYKISIDTNIFGEAFVLKVGRSDNSGVVGLKYLDPLKMQIQRDNNNNVIQYSYDGNVYNVDPVTGESQIIHFLYTTNHVYEQSYVLSPLRSCFIPVSLLLDSMNWNRTLVRNHAKPSGVLTTSTPLTEQAVQKLTEQRDYLLGKPGGVPLLPAGVDFEELGFKPSDMDFKETLTMARQFVAQAFRVPLPIVDSTASTLNNSNVAREEFYSELIIPFTESLLEQLIRGIQESSNDFENYELRINEDEIDSLAERRNRIVDLLLKLQNNGNLSINQVNEELGYELWDLQEANEPLSTNNPMPIGLSDPINNNEQSS